MSDRISKKIEGVRRPHPSGRPRRVDYNKEIGYPRIPNDEPLTPRLRKREFEQAIGFTAAFRDEDE